MPFFRKKPVVIEAIQVTEENLDQIRKMPGVRIHRHGDNFEDSPGTLAFVRIVTLEGPMRADPGDWIIKEPFPTNDRKFYPCKPDIFAETYEEVSDE